MKLKRWFGLQSVLIFGVLFAGCDRPSEYLYVQPPLAEADKSIPPDPNLPRGSVQGIVNNAANGAALRGVQVDVHFGDASAPIYATGHTNISGYYSITGLPPGLYTFDYSLFGFIPVPGVPVRVESLQTTTQNVTLTTVLNDGQYRIVVNWCDVRDGAVRDVDSYLHIPGQNPGSPIGYRNLNDNMGAKLDFDDTTWVGPETITITELRQGSYSYYVNNYNARGDTLALGRTSVIIRLYGGNQLLRTYSVPPGRGNTYEVFRIENGAIVDVEAYNDRLPVY